MRIFRHTSQLPEDARRAVVAVGNFDGVHLGHRAVIDAAGAEARAQGAPQAVLTFEPHPRSHFRPDTPPYRLTPFRIKARQIESLGVDLLFVLHFDHAFSQRPAESFVADILVGELETRHLVTGANFVFGRGRAGDAELLAKLAADHGFGYTRLEPVEASAGVPYSSTRVRDHLVAGRPDLAAALLGRPWEIEGRVEPGERIGRKLGFRTANVPLGDYLRPATGVYAVRAGIDRGEMTEWRDGVANLGRRPTFDGTSILLEVHLLDHDADLYGRHLRVALIAYLRAEKKFDDVDGLKAQIAEDCAAARRLLAGREMAPAAAPR